MFDGRIPELFLPSFSNAETIEGFNAVKKLDLCGASRLEGVRCILRFFVTTQLGQVWQSPD